MALRSRSHVKASMVLTRADHYCIYSVYIVYIVYIHIYNGHLMCDYCREVANSALFSYIPQLLCSKTLPRDPSRCFLLVYVNQRQST